MATRNASVAIAVPAPALGLGADARQSLRHLRAYRGAHDAFAVLPQGLEGTIAGLPAKRFRASAFRNTSRYSRLLVSDEFYAAFSDYEYVLVHQLDCLVFSDELDA